MQRGLVGSEMCIRDRVSTQSTWGVGEHLLLFKNSMEKHIASLQQENAFLIKRINNESYKNRLKKLVKQLHSFKNRQIQISVGLDKLLVTLNHAKECSLLYSKYLAMVKKYLEEKKNCICSPKEDTKFVDPKLVYQIVGDKIYTYDLESKATERLKLPQNKLQTFVSHIRIGSDVYFCGGINNKIRSILDSVFVFNLFRPLDGMKEESPMLVPKYQHCLVSLKHNFLYAIGGTIEFNGVTFSSKVVEKFYIRKHEWEQGPELMEPRLNPSACAFDNQFIYVFGGYFDKEYLEDIEMLDFNKEEELGWVYVPYKKEGKGLMIRRSSAGSFQIDSQRIIVFGGKNSSALNSCVIFNSYSKIVTTLSSTMKSKGCFDGNNSFFTFKNSLYCVDTANKLHVLDTADPKLSWSILDLKRWKKQLSTFTHNNKYSLNIANSILIGNDATIISLNQELTLMILLCGY
eukprot:TRINITY_DN813_c0_g1_i1.p1 TRINITY_DN813_c0_g1~~TRINITY_DN813_c0_g1_i1.p1  ORF type:complete len:460 (+),score=52.41 TRINITY_DN813_c0_g1_i1:166-1545(+)